MCETVDNKNQWFIRLNGSFWTIMKCKVKKLNQD